MLFILAGTTKIHSLGLTLEPVLRAEVRDEESVGCSRYILHICYIG